MARSWDDYRRRRRFHEARRRNYRAALKNTQQSARIRQALGHHLAHYTLGRIDPECAKLAAAAALESQKPKHCLHGYQYGWILHGFNQLPVDDAWKIAAQEHWDAWAARNANGGLSKYGPHDWAVNSMLRMVARSGNEDWARTMLSQFHETLSNEQSGVASLVMGGMPKLAAEHFKTEWRGFFVNAQNEILWSQEIQANLHAFKQACADPGLAMLGELYLSHLKDPAKPDQEAIPGFKNKETRLKEIAAHFKEITFTDPELRKECVELICMDYDAAAIIQDVAEEVGIATDLEQIGSYENTLEHGQQCKPLQFALGMKAARGENQPAIAAFDKALAVSFNSTYYHRNLLKEVSSGPVHVSQWQWAQEFKADKPSNTKELLLFLEHVITKTPANLRDNHVTDCVSLKWLIHLIHQDAAAFDAWQKSLKPTDLKELASSVGDNWQIWSFLQGYALPANKERLKPEERLLLITSVLKNSWTQEKYPGSGPGIPNLIIDLIQKAKLFKPDEFVAVAVPISEALPRAGRTAVEAGDYLVAQGKSKEAVAMYALAVSHAQKEKPTDYGLAGGFAIKQIETLENTQQRPEALKALKALDPKRLGGGNKKIYETALKRLSSPAAETSK
ncbi:MAG: hypothetical protein NTV80_00120 [Verrucomicrobia bacterium]|nr:hypothetical protein [Verrucomicrobiota bacterium]